MPTGENLLMDNTNVCHCDLDTPAITVNTKLAFKMGWLRKASSGLILRPNLQQEFMGDQVPNMKIKSEWNDVNDEEGNPVFWTVLSFVSYYLQLSMSCRWRFTNLNITFRSVVGEPTRSLHVYSDVAGSTIVGFRVTDLLLEVKYKREGRGATYIEPLHIQFMPLPTAFIELIETQVAETDGELVKFGEGNTIITLHFEKT